MRTRPTSGPWTAVSGMVETEHGADICDCRPEHFGQAHLKRSIEEVHANAAFISSAWEMFDALQLARVFVEEELEVRKISFLPGGSAYLDDAESALRIIKSAIASAMDGER